jgi:general stress protein 26
MPITLDSTTSLQEKIVDIRIGMLTTSDPAGTLVSRPMTSQKFDKDGLLWFFTSDLAKVAKEIEYNAAINVSFSSKEDSLYVSVSGNAEIVKDKAMIKEMWNPMVGAWFPEGADDPHVALIKVTVVAADYWNSDKSKMMQLFEMAKAAVTGNPPTGMGEHRKIDI